MINFFKIILQNMFQLHLATTDKKKITCVSFLVCVVKQKLSLDSKEILNVTNYHDIYTERGITVYPPGGGKSLLSIYINFPRERYDIANVSFTIDQTVSFMVYLSTEEQESVTVNTHFITSKKKVGLLFY